MNQYCLEIEDVITVNRSLIDNYFNVIDQTKLEGALAAPLQTWDGEYLYLSPLERAAILLERIANAHAFLDGNKRTAWVCGVAYLEQCGFIVEYIEDNEVVEFMVDVTENRMSTEAIALWFANHLA